MCTALKTRVFKNIDDIGRDPIDSLVDDGFFTYGWFKTLEQSKPFNSDPLYIAAFYNGKLVAFVPCFFDVSDQYFSFGSLVPFMKRGLKLGSSLHLSRKHVLLAYSPFCYRTKCFTRSGLNKRVLTYSLLKKIDEICKKEKILFSAFLFVSEFDNNLLSILSESGYHKSVLASNYYLDVVWSDFEDYLASLDKRTRNRIRREIKSCGENGITVEDVKDIKGISTKLSDLSSNLRTKYNKIPARFFDSSFYASLNEHARKNIKTFIAKKNDAVTGFSLCLRQGKILDVFQCGFDYELQGKTDFTYFNLAYYVPIRWAIQEGINKIYYRQMADRVKLKRGCKRETMYSFVKCHNKLMNSQLGNIAKIKNWIF